MLMVLSAAWAARTRCALHCSSRSRLLNAQLGCTLCASPVWHANAPQGSCAAMSLFATMLSHINVLVAGLQWFKKLELTVEPSKLKSGQQPPRAADIRPVSTELISGVVR